MSIKSLRPMSKEQTLWMWGCTGFCTALLLIGWYFTVGRVVGQGVDQLKTDVGQGIAATQKTVAENSQPIDKLQTTVDKLKQTMKVNGEFLVKKQAVDAVIAKQVADDIKAKAGSVAGSGDPTHSLGSLDSKK